MEIAKFILTAVGTFLSVFGLSFTVFQYWKKKQDEKFTGFKTSIENLVQKEYQARCDSLSRFDKRIEFLEHSVLQALEKRLSVIEGELKGIKPTLQNILNWFISNAPTGKK
jgi:hypothetical protein